jgi:regulator of protease activity HflC (stomatin/prohibitin superfamily)
MSPKTTFKLVLAAALFIFTVTMWGNLVETVPAGKYHITQAAVSGTMGAQNTPGMYGQWFADVLPFPQQETFFFTSEKDADGDTAVDMSIEVRFADASVANISGTARVIMPIVSVDQINLVSQRSYRDYRAIEQKLILPTVRKALMLTANMMTARESYAEKRSNFIEWAKDQVENGPYITETTEKVVKDLLSGEEVTRQFRVPKADATTGGFQRQHNPLDGTGIRLANFEVKNFRYEPRVTAQIEKQQEALMAVATSKAEAEKANQEKIKAEAEGQRNVMTAKYETEQQKIKAVVQAQQEYETAEIQAKKLLTVADLDKQRADEDRQATILRASGIADSLNQLAKARKALMSADNALDKKLAAMVQIQGRWADAYAKRNVPTTVFAGSNSDGNGGLDGSTAAFMNMLMLNQAKQLDVSTSVSK